MYSRCLFAIGDGAEFPVSQALVTEDSCGGSLMWSLIEAYKRDYGFKRVNIHCCDTNMCNDFWPEDVPRKYIHLENISGVPE